MLECAGRLSYRIFLTAYRSIEVSGVDGDAPASSPGFSWRLAYSRSFSSRDLYGPSFGGKSSSEWL